MLHYAHGPPQRYATFPSNLLDPPPGARPPPIDARTLGHSASPRDGGRSQQAARGRERGASRERGRSRERSQSRERSRNSGRERGRSGSRGRDTTPGHYGPASHTQRGPSRGTSPANDGRRFQPGIPGVGDPSKFADNRKIQAPGAWGTGATGQPVAPRSAGVGDRRDTSNTVRCHKYT